MAQAWHGQAARARVVLLCDRAHILARSDQPDIMAKVTRLRGRRHTRGECASWATWAGDSVCHRNLIRRRSCRPLWAFIRFGLNSFNVNAMALSVGTLYSARARPAQIVVARDHTVQANADHAGCDRFSTEWAHWKYSPCII
jgi:hypothetical protein